MANNRLRVIVLAVRQFDRPEKDSETSSSPQLDIKTEDFWSPDLDYCDLKLVGIVGLELNFKDGVKEALSELKDAKIDIRAVTVD